MKKLLLILIFAVLLSSQCLAEPYDEQELYGSLPDYASELAGDTDADPNESLEAIGKAVNDTISENLGSSLGRALKIIAVGVICGVLAVFCEDTADYVSLGGCAAVAVISMSDVGSFIASGEEVINTLSGFSQTLLPAMCAASAACGTVGAATVKYAVTVLFMDAFTTLAQTVILPVIYAYLAVTVAAASFGSESLGGIAKLLKKACVFLLTSVSLGFTLYIGISSVVASGGDAAASKLAKAAISASLPVVGGIISDAASTVVAASELLRDALGVFGMLALLAVCAVPLTVVALNYLVYKLAAAAVNAMGCKRLSELTNGIGRALGMLLGLAGCCAIILFVSMAVSIKGVGG